jgi:hypothetical protein
MTKRGSSLTTNFSSGELDSKLRGRPDLTAYVQGATRFRNLQPFAAGGARPRPGLRLRQTLAGAQRLLEFVFDDDEKYLIGIGNLTLSFYDADGSLLQSGVGPWTWSQAYQVTYAQLYDVMFLAHRDVPRQKITRTGLSTFTVEPVAEESFATGVSKAPAWRYAPTNYGIGISAQSGSVAAGVYKDNGATAVTDFWTDDHIGVRIRMNDSDNTIAGEIIINGPVTPGSQNIPATVVGTELVAGTISASAFTLDWTETAFNAARGYPAAVGIYGERLWWGGGRSAPEGVWASRIGAFYDHAIGPEDDDPIRGGLTGDRVQEIRHIVSPKNIGFLTRDSEWINLEAQGGGSPTPANFEPKHHTTYGASYGVKPVFYDGAIMFSQKSGRAIRELRWEELEQVYQAESVSILAGHLIQAPVDSAVQYGAGDEPESFAYFVNADGSIAVLHAIRSQKVAGWGLWHLSESHDGYGGYTMDNDLVTMDTTTLFSMDGQNPTGRFMSVAALDERLYAVVLREGVYTLEEFDHDLFVDKAITVSLTTPGKVFTGLSALEGETVWAVWRGYVLGSGVVVDATLDLSAASIPNVTDIDIGLFFKFRLTLMPADFTQALTGNVQQGKVRRIVRAILIPEDLRRVLVNGWPLIQQTRSIGGVTLAVPTSDPEEFYLYDSTRSPQVDIVNDQPTGGSILSVHAEVVSE